MGRRGRQGPPPPNCNKTLNEQAHTLITTYPLGMEDLGMLRNLLEGAADGVEVLVGLKSKSLEKRGERPTQRTCCGHGDTCATSCPSCWTRTRRQPCRKRSRSSRTGRESTGGQNSWKSWKTTARTIPGGGQNFEHHYHRSGEWRGGQSLVQDGSQAPVRQTRMTRGFVLEAR